MPIITQVADALAQELTAADFGSPLTVHRAYLPRIELKDLTGILLSVVPKSLAQESLTRSSDVATVVIDVALQQKLQHEDLATLDPLLDLAERLAHHFRRRRLPAYPAALCLNTEFKPIYAPEHIEDLRVFTSVLTLTFRVSE